MRSCWQMNIFLYKSLAQPHFPRTRLIIVENTQSGIAIPPSYFEKVRSLLDRVNATREKNRKIFFHCDGARLFNAISKCGVTLRDYYVLRINMLCSGVGTDGTRRRGRGRGRLPREDVNEELCHSELECDIASSVPTGSTHTTDHILIT